MQTRLATMLSPREIVLSMFLTYSTCVGSAGKPRFVAGKAAVTDGLIDGTTDEYVSDEVPKLQVSVRLNKYCCDV